MTTIELVCLGVGAGKSYVLHGRPSTAFALLVDGSPELLVDCGAGVALSYKRNVGKPLPLSIYISHNHIDHTGDLPIVLAHLLKDGPRVLGESGVLEIVREHRLHDAPVVQEFVTSAVTWVAPDEDSCIELAAGLALKLIRTLHSYRCFGFVLLQEGQPILGYSADTPYDEKLYRQFAVAPIVILDGREPGNFDHASLEEIDMFGGLVPDRQVFAVHHDRTNYTFRHKNVHLMAEGQRLVLHHASETAV